MKRLFVPVFVILFSVGFISSVSAQDKSAKQETKEAAKDNSQNAEVKVVKSDVKAVNKVCPVSTEDIDDPVKVEYKGKVYALCCKTCLKKFQKDPDKYVSRLDDNGDLTKKK